MGIAQKSLENTLSKLTKHEVMCFGQPTTTLVSPFPFQQMFKSFVAFVSKCYHNQGERLWVMESHVAYLLAHFFLMFTEPWESDKYCQVKGLQKSFR